MSSRAKLFVAALVLVGGVTARVSGQQDSETEIFVDQGWSGNQVETWYGLSQGSRLIPLDWLQSLEQAGSQEPFLSPANMRRFRYLPDPGATGPNPLPVGFAIDAQSDEPLSEVTRLRWRKGQGDRAPWVGMNCAGCHTGELTYHSLRLRIQGAPALSDFQGFMSALNRALEATQADQSKWRRFEDKVLGTAAGSDDRQMLSQEFGKLLAWQGQVEQANLTPLQYGFARLDAFGHIYNKVLLRVNASGQTFNPSDAPVSYPFLWNIHQQDKVQWNGSAPNKPLEFALDIGALARNVGEVTGVFADLQVLGFGPALVGYPTSANIENLLAIENQITKLKPPVWPDQFPAIDPDKWEAGKKLFADKRFRCADCHSDKLSRNDLTSRITVSMTKLSGKEPIGTDPWMACNAYAYAGSTGELRNTPKAFFFPSLPIYGGKSPVSDMLSTVVVGSIWNRGGDVISGLESKLKGVDPFDLNQAPQDVLALASQTLSLNFSRAAKVKPLADEKAARLQICMNADKETLAYKGRPLIGVWATAPFLHNGSVPTLYDLLLPPANRPTRFSLGTREFDPEKVGFVNEHSSDAYRSARATVENTWVFNVSDANGLPISGNSNLGHDYGNAKLSESDRWALVEYMKAVGASRIGNRVVP